MNKVSYIDMRHIVLDALYSHLISKPEMNLSYDRVLDYVTYDFESGYSDTEYLIISFVIYVLCGDFKSSEYLSKILREKLLSIINSNNFIKLISRIEDNDDKKEFIADLCTAGLISKDNAKTFR
ncbi:hypothetical protein [Psychrobacter sp. I-STPA10]|uniref:hypothetical protein n=1 Tax=Psychrobacter sp. I-STPA10 TaxID=2585769 RepID=UPI001E4A5E41|nr:hypothetical protein [Psychrobacter sp. I-STPA10]